MRFMVLTSIVFILACKSTDDDGQQDTDTDTGPEEILSTFEMGDFRVGSLELNTVGDGPDQNGDSIGDNNLPNALALVDVAISDQDFSRDGFNALIATSIEEQVLNIMLRAQHAHPTLQKSVFAGAWDADREQYTLTEGSTDADGNPMSLFEGSFSSQTTFRVQADDAVLPVTFIIEDAPYPVPLTGAVMQGELDANTSVGQISGVIPAAEMVENVIAPMIPEEGASGLTKSEILELVTNLTTNETLMDVQFDDGTRGISAAFTYSASSATIAEESE